MKRKMKNKKGFTLVELLAVIVILGVLLLIAVPSITSIIDNSKKNAFVSTSKMIAENVENLAIMDSYIGASTYCAIPIDSTNIKLDRGSLGTISGYVTVEGKTVKVFASDEISGTNYATGGVTLTAMNEKGYKPTSGISYATPTTLQTKDVCLTASGYDLTIVESSCTGTDKTWKDDVKGYTIGSEFFAKCDF